MTEADAGFNMLKGEGSRIWNFATQTLNEGL